MTELLREMEPGELEFARFTIEIQVEFVRLIIFIVIIIVIIASAIL